MKKTFYLLFLFVSVHSWSQEAYLGEIRLTAFSFPPQGWAFCNGQLLPINQHQALFALLGTTYGGNGVNSFALPDLRGRAVMGMSSSLPIGTRTGTETTTITIANMPQHSHTLLGTSLAGNTNVPTNAVLANTGALDKEYSNTTPNTVLNTAAVSTTGGSQPVNNMQPSLTLNYIICLTGIFPSQN